jgi:hypothetical protein
MADHLLLGLGPPAPNNANNANNHNLGDNLEDNFEAMVKYEQAMEEFLALCEEDRQEFHNLRKQELQERQQDRQEFHSLQDRQQFRALIGQAVQLAMILATFLLPI